MRRFLEYTFIATLIITTAWLLVGCTFTINLVHTMGKADDIIDETATPTANTELTIPVHGL